MRLRLFSEGPIGDEEIFKVALTQRRENESTHGAVGEFEISGRELKQILATLDCIFQKPNELPFDIVKEVFSERTQH